MLLQKHGGQGRNRRAGEGATSIIPVSVLPLLERLFRLVHVPGERDGMGGDGAPARGPKERVVPGGGGSTLTGRTEGAASRRGVPRRKASVTEIKLEGYRDHRHHHHRPQTQEN